MFHKAGWLLLSLHSFSAAAQQAEPSRQHLAPPRMEAAYHERHYTPVVKVGDTVIVSGIPAGGPGSYEDQIRRCS